MENSIITQTEVGTRVTLPQILDFEELLRKEPAANIPVTHYFSEGVYAREIFVPAGTTLTGLIHKYSNLNIMLTGEMSVSIDGVMTLVKAPFIAISPPGTKRVAHALQDTRWITIHGTHETDVEKIEHQFIAHTQQEYIDFCAEQLLIKGA